MRSTFTGIAYPHCPWLQYGPGPVPWKEQLFPQAPQSVGLVLKKAVVAQIPLQRVPLGNSQGGCATATSDMAANPTMQAYWISMLQRHRAGRRRGRQGTTASMKKDVPLVNDGEQETS